TGLLVPINDSKTLAEAINRVLADAAFAENLVTGGFTAYEAAFTEAEVVRQYQEFFEKVTR
ncbi:MAG: glycosyltransferase, partial [Pseudomonadota bacterium]|nr:glycosyltransferase [Pseudomonadota bacterium]